MSKTKFMMMIMIMCLRSVATGDEYGCHVQVEGVHGRTVTVEYL